MWDAIDAAFHIGDRPVFFCVGDRIYNPNGAKLTTALVAHENVHRVQQGANVEGWWAAYLKDPEFRCSQEIPAHRAEYQEFCKTAKRRNERRLYLNDAARRLSGPLYGGIIDYEAARKAIKWDPKDG